MTTQLKVKQNKDEPVPDFHGYTLIMPSVGIGNVGQLAVDLLITSLKLKRVAHFFHPSLLPIAGYDPYNEGSEEVITAGDIHISTEKLIAVLQLRSPVIKVEKNQFIKDISEWFEESGFADVIILASTWAFVRQDPQLAGSQVRYLPNNVLHPKMDSLKKIGPIELEELPNEYGVKKRMMSCTGLTPFLLDSCKIPCVALLKFAYEGDNTEDAMILSSYLNDWLNLQDKSSPWVKPFSWKNFYGPPPPQQIY